MKVLVLLSGGLDSMVVLAQCVAGQGVQKVGAITFDYNQSSSREIQCATRICKDWRVPHIVQRIVMHSSSDTHVEIPGRNSIFLSYALAYALQNDYDTIAIGAEPDATYIDSSVEFIRASDQLMRLFGVSVIAPVKGLAGKKAIVEQALELGVPLHLCHSSRSETVDGKCSTSKRFLDSLAELFPRIDPVTLLTQLATLHTAQESETKFCICYNERNQVYSFKWPAALMSLGAWDGGEAEVTVFTTGSWGAALAGACCYVQQPPELRIVRTQRLSELLSNAINTNALAARWGTLQALSALPRPRYAPTLGCRITQGHLADAARALGYTVVAPNAKPDILLETAV